MRPVYRLSPFHALAALVRPDALAALVRPVYCLSPLHALAALARPVYRLSSFHALAALVRPVYRISLLHALAALVRPVYRASHVSMRWPVASCLPAPTFTRALARAVSVRSLLDRLVKQRGPPGPSPCAAC